MTESRTSGAVISINRNGNVEYFEALGFQDRARGVPMQRESIFRIASMTKPLVAVAVLMMMEEGRIALLDPIEWYIPAFSRMQVGSEHMDPVDGTHRLSLDPASRSITIHDLLRHTSGLTSSLFGGGLVRQMYRDAHVRDEQQSNAELMQKLARLPLMHQPGTTFEYGMSTDVLGYLVELLSGMDLNRFLIDKIAAPLGLRDTCFLLGDGGPERLALPQSDNRDFGSATLSPLRDASPLRWFSGGSGALSTAADYSRFCQMLVQGGSFEGERILAPKSVALLRSDQLPPGIAYGPNTIELGITAPLPEYGQSYGLGVGVRTRLGLSPVLGSIGDFFWGGALGTYFWVDPETRLSAVLMMQELEPMKRARYRSALRNLTYQALAC
jgi:CubicO group peptidase (beta-lactamase class C family)